ncbi:MAG: hypothetical protein WB607_15470, partial [Candidatus Acidiferrum sp.]
GRPNCVVMLMAPSHFLIHPPKLTVAIQSAKLALLQSDTQALECDAQGSSVRHRRRKLIEPTRYNPGPATLAPTRLSLKRSLRPQHGLQLRLAIASSMPGPGFGNRRGTTGL